MGSSFLDNLLFGITGLWSKAHVDFSMLTIDSKEASADNSPNLHQADLTDPSFATSKKCFVLKGMVHQMSLVHNWIDLHIQPFEGWIPSSILEPTRIEFHQIINNNHGDYFEQMIETRYSLSNRECAKIFSISDPEVMFAADEAHKEILLSEISREFLKQCDITMKNHLGKLCEVAKSVLAEKQDEQQQRDLEREKLLITRVKLTMIDDYLNLGP